MTTVTKTDLIDHEGDIDGGTSYNVPPDNGRCVTKHVPSGPSSLAKINLMEGLGVCNAFQASPSGQNVTLTSSLRNYAFVRMRGMFKTLQNRTPVL